MPRHSALLSEDIIYELPRHEWHDVAGSRVTSRDLMKAFFRLVRIYGHSLQPRSPHENPRPNRRCRWARTATLIRPNGFRLMRESEPAYSSTTSSFLSLVGTAFSSPGQERPNHTSDVATRVTSSAICIMRFDDLKRHRVSFEKLPDTRIDRLNAGCHE